MIISYILGHNMEQKERRTCMMHFAVKDTLTNDDIKQCRKKFGLSQAEFAELMNVSKKR